MKNRPIREVGLTALDADPHVTSLSVTSGAVIANVAEFTADEGVLDKTLRGFYLVDTEKSLLADSGAISSDLYHIDAIVSTSGAFSVNVAQTGDLSNLLNKVYRGFDVIDTAANVLGGLASLDDEIAHIDAIAISGGAKVTVDGEQLLEFSSVMKKIGGGVVLDDASSLIFEDVKQVTPLIGDISSIALTDASARTLNWTLAQFQTDAPLIKKVTSSCVLEVALGSETRTVGRGADLTIQDVPSDNVITGQGASDMFAFGQNFGTAVIADAASWYAGAHHETIELSHLDFASFKVLQGSAGFAGGVTTINHGSEKLVIDGISSLAALQAANAAGVFEFT